jgi:hypothetical protein
MKNSIDNMVNTGDHIVKRYGFHFEVPPMSNWPEDKPKFFIAEEVKEIGDQVIDKWRTDLQNMNIGYIFKPKAPRKDDVVTLGTAKAEPENEKVFHGIQAVVTIGFDMWLLLSLDQKVRLVYHELEHVGRDMESGEVKMQKHTVEEFASVIEKFGPEGDNQIALINAWEAFKNNNGK